MGMGQFCVPLRIRVYLRYNVAKSYVCTDGMAKMGRELEDTGLTMSIGLPLAYNLFPIIARLKILKRSVKP